MRSILQAMQCKGVYWEIFALTFASWVIQPCLLIDESPVKVQNTILQPDRYWRLEANYCKHLNCGTYNLCFKGTLVKCDFLGHKTVILWGVNECLHLMYKRSLKRPIGHSRSSVSRHHVSAWKLISVWRASLRFYYVVCSRNSPRDQRLYNR